MPTSKIIHGDCRSLMQAMDPGSVHCVVTSPPYWSLRDYGLGMDALGFETSPQLYIQHLVEIFQGVRRVLRDDGTLFLNLGDRIVDGERVGTPWRAARALRYAGWRLVGDIIWYKTDANMDSASTRPRRRHENIFVFTKNKHAFWDVNGVASQIVRGDVWPIATSNYKGAHFAVFPEQLTENCIRLSTSQKGCCPKCGTGWVRIVKKNRVATRPSRDNKQDGTGMANRNPGRHVTETTTTGWLPGCECICGVGLDAYPVMPCQVLDPFCGSGTVGVVCKREGRNFIGLDLNKEYCEMAKRRISGDPK